MPLVIEGMECACLGDPTGHGSPLAPGIGALTVLYNGRPIWRTLMDFHACPIVKGVVPDVGGVVTIGAMRTMVMGGLAARKGDMVMEIPGGPNPIIPGAMGIGGMAGQVMDAVVAAETPLASSGPALGSVDAFESPLGSLPPFVVPIIGPDDFGPPDIPISPTLGLPVTFDPNGDAHVGNITIQHDPKNPTYVLDTLLKLAAINDTPSGKAMLDDLQASGKHVTIKNGNSPVTSRASTKDAVPAGTQFTQNGVPQVGTGKGSDSTIVMPQNFPVGPPGGPPAPQDTVLFHELTHADHNARGDNRTAESPVDPAMENREEENTINAENQYLQERGYPFHRTGHNGDFQPNLPPLPPP